MNVILWVIQVLLAVAFLVHGRAMLSPPASLNPGMAYVTDLPAGPRRLIGVLEILGAIGLVLPWLTGILPWLTPLAAAGLVVLMAGAALYHIPRREYGNIVLNLILLAVAAFVAYGRFVDVSIS